MRRSKDIQGTIDDKVPKIDRTDVKLSGYFNCTVSDEAGYLVAATALTATAAAIVFAGSVIATKHVSQEPTTPSAKECRPLIDYHRFAPPDGTYFNP